MSGQPQMQSLVHEPRVETDGASVRKRIGFIVGGGAFAAIASSLPVSFRTGGEGSVGLVLERWLVLSAVTIPLAVAAVAVMGRARAGLRMVVGERKTPLLLGVLWWSVIQVGLLSVAGAFLRKTTHHHALAGVTFAMVALASGIVVALFAGRTTALLARAGARAQLFGFRIAALCACIVVLIIGLRTSGAEGMHTTAMIADGFALVVTTMLASSRWGRRWKRTPIVGVPAAVAVIVAGLVTLRFDAALQKSLEDTAPVFALVSGVFGD